MAISPNQLAGLDPDIDAESACAIFGIKLEDLMHELNYRKQKKAAQMHREMARAAKQGGETRIIRTKEGDGYVDIQIHPVSYHYWGQRLGYQCWDDPQFVREYKRDNEAARVKSTSDRLTLRMPGISPASAKPSGVRGKRGRWAA